MQFLALIEAIAGAVNPSNVSDMIALVEKIIALGESIKDHASSAK